MNVTDPRELGDRELLMYLVFGDLARPGWSNRRRQIAMRMLELAALTIAAVLILIGLGIAFTFLWASLLPRPA